MRKLILFLAAVSLVLFAEKALCYETTFSIEPESFNSFRYEEMREQKAAPLSIRTGRFLSVDPGRDWDLHQPQSWNMYSYVRNNPINNTDPDGKWCLPCLAPLVPVVIRAAPAVQRTAQRAYIYLSNPANVQRAINAVIGTARVMSTGAMAEAQAPAVSWPGWDSTKPPDGFTDWRGKAGAAPGTNAVGAWVNPDTGEYLSPDLDHADPKGAHWTYGDAEGNKWDVYPDGTVAPAEKDKPPPPERRRKKETDPKE